MPRKQRLFMDHRPTAHVAQEPEEKSLRLVVSAIVENEGTIDIETIRLWGLLVRWWPEVDPQEPA